MVASSLLPVELPWSLYFAGILSSWPFLCLRAPHHHSIKPSSSLSVDLVVENVPVLSWLSSLLCRSAEVAEMVKAGRLRSFLERHRFTRFSQAMREARKPYRSRKVNALYTFVLRHILRLYEQTVLEILPVGITIHLNDQHCHRLSPARSVCVSLNAALICGVCHAVRTACLRRCFRYARHGQELVGAVLTSRPSCRWRCKKSVLICLVVVLSRFLFFATRIRSGLVGHVTMTNGESGGGEAGGVGRRVSAPTPLVRIHAVV